MDNSSADDKTAKPEKPSPSDFDEYLPYACKELQIDANIVVSKVQSMERPTGIKSGKSKKSMIFRPKIALIENKSSVASLTSLGKSDAFELEDTVKINAMYDGFGNLIQLTFDKNKQIPRGLIQLIGLFIHYHTFMLRITIKSGFDHACLHELNKLVTLANITDVCLDDTALHGGNYNVLIEDKNSKLKNLSIARCKIDDAMVKKIAINLTYPLPSSHNLSVLNLTSNLITDAGAKYLAEALRSNRQLAYLNLSDNNITDKGAQEIFEVLQDFLLTDKEMFALRQRKVQYIKEKNLLIDQIVDELKNADCPEKTSKKKLVKPNSAATPTASAKKGDKDLLRTAVNKSNTDLDSIWIKKAKIVANERMGPFVDPFAAEYVYSRDYHTYCYGNNSIAFINISYNEITYCTVKKILTVLLTQQRMNRTPRGLVKVTLEGNYLPEQCDELEQIDCILMSHLSQRRQTIFKPKR